MLPHVRFGDGETRYVVLCGGDAFMQPFSRERARRAARIFPDDATVHVVGYAPPARSVDALVEDIGSVLEEAGPAILAGISFGGVLAVRVAARYGDVVRGLVLVSSGRRFSDEGRDRVRQQIADARRGDLVAMAPPFLTLFRRTWRNALTRAVFALRRDKFAASLNAPDYIATMLAIGLEAETGVIIHVPALTIIGSRDQFFDAAHAVGDHRIFDGETHTLALERPRDVRKAIAEFALQRRR